MKNCNICGKLINDTASFCRHCGAEQAAPAAEITPATHTQLNEAAEVVRAACNQLLVAYEGSIQTLEERATSAETSLQAVKEELDAVKKQAKMDIAAKDSLIENLNLTINDLKYQISTLSAANEDLQNAIKEVRENAQSPSSPIEYEEPKAPVTPTCPQCGIELDADENAIFCWNCGHKLS